MEAALLTVAEILRLVRVSKGCRMGGRVLWRSHSLKKDRKKRSVGENFDCEDLICNWMSEGGLHAA